MKVNKYVLNSCITALILAIVLVVFYIIIKVGGSKKDTPKEEKVEPQTSEQITISFDSNGGTAAKDIKVNKGSSITLPTVTREGYEFNGWYLDDTKVSDKTKFISDSKLTAKWTEEKEEIKTFKVTFKTDSTTYKTLTVDCDSELHLPAAPSKEGYNFISWVDKNETPILEGALLTCDDVTLYANFEKQEEEKKFKVYFYNDDEKLFAIQEIKCGDELNILEEPTKEGYYLTWKDKNGVPISNGALLACEDIKLDAYWQKIEEPKEENKEENNEEKKD